jgi:hypothetical protein
VIGVGLIVLGKTKRVKSKRSLNRNLKKKWIKQCLKKLKNKEKKTSATELSRYLNKNIPTMLGKIIKLNIPSKTNFFSSTKNILNLLNLN